MYYFRSYAATRGLVEGEIENVTLIFRRNIVLLLQLKALGFLEAFEKSADRLGSAFIFLR